MRNGKTKKRSLTQSVFRMICLGVYVIIAITLMVLVGELYNYFTRIHYDSLEYQTKLIAKGIEKYGISYLDDLEPTYHNLMWLDKDGNTLFDTTDDDIDKDEREAFLKARQEGLGEGMKILPTLTEKYIYSAYRLADGSVIIVSEKQFTFFSPIMGFIQRLVIIVAGAVILSFILAHLLTAKLLSPINRIDLSDPLGSDTYSEISPLLEQIEYQQNRLRQKQIEFEAATDNMHEGLVITAKNGHIISMNRAAADIFSIDRSRMYDISLAESEDFGYLFRTAHEGNVGEITVNVNDTNYLISASPIVSDGEVTGAVFFIFGMTEHEKSDLMRREFTANVSHELKTPLQSISGYAELLKNGMVRSEDVSKFGDRIYSEARRVTLLVEDILKLSKLDEGVPDMQTAEADLFELVGSEVRALRDTPEADNVTISAVGESVMITCYPALVTAIVHNLCENALKYNRRGGSVTVTVKDEGETAVLTVSDTGIGIPPEHIDRIFERFYRVDKSRSKQVGGTGLGLAIVKHAAGFHGAKLSVDSTLGVGTTVTVTFPKNQAA